MSETTEQVPVLGKDGALWASLSRKTNQIKEERALTILEDAHTAYERKIEDLMREYRKLSRALDATLDMSPQSTTTLKMPDFDALAFVDNDLSSDLAIYKLAVTINRAKNRYNKLFGFKYKIEEGYGI